MIVIDASLALDLFLVTTEAETLEEQLHAAGGGLCAPEVFDLEIMQTVRRLRYAGEISAERADAAFDILDHAPVERFSHELLRPRIWALKDNLTAYDAAYFALAELLQAPLWTRDQKFAGVPQHGAEIVVV